MRLRQLRFQTHLSPLHTSNNVEATFDFVEATFDIVERIVQLVAFYKVACCFDNVAGMDGALHATMTIIDVDTSEILGIDKRTRLRDDCVGR